MTHPVPPQTEDNASEALRQACALLQGRRTTLPKRLTAPGPNAEQRASILGAAATAPDHGQALPWRFVEVPEAQRGRLAQAFARALLERDPLATQTELALAREKADRTPWLLVAICRVRGGNPDIPAAERLLSAGCAIQNMLLLATALG
ncbi:MAG: hypothetical protein RLZZ555_1938, partial [Pseudomonadota bacterium]